MVSGNNTGDAPLLPLPLPFPFLCQLLAALADFKERETISSAATLARRDFSYSSSGAGAGAKAEAKEVAVLCNLTPNNKTMIDNLTSKQAAAGNFRSSAVSVWLWFFS